MRWFDRSAADLVFEYRCLPPHNVLTIPAPWQGSAVSELVSGRAYAKMGRELQLAPLEAVVLRYLNALLAQRSPHGEAEKAPPSATGTLP